MKHLLVACMGLAFGLISCKEERKLVGSWEVVKIQEVSTIKNHPIAARNVTIDTTIYPKAGESEIWTFTKKGVLLKQNTYANGNTECETYSYMIIDKTLYCEGAEVAISINGKEMTLTYEDVEDRLEYYDEDGNWLPMDQRKKYQEYNKEVRTLKER